MVNHASLFSGIGGFDLAAQWVGWTNVFQVEIDEFCQKVLTKNFPNVTKYRDIYEFKGEKYRGQVDVISGGFPCQPFSQAGKRQGTKDDRYLWPEMLRIITEVRPAWVVGENVAGLLSMENGRTLEKILTDLEDEGYQVEVFLIPACGIGAWHRRDRVWIVANSKCTSNFKYVEECGIQNKRNEKQRIRCSHWDELILVNGRMAPRKWKHEGYKINTKSLLCRNINGLSSGLDRLKGLGNAIVPQVAHEIFKAIDLQ